MLTLLANFIPRLRAVLELGEEIRVVFEQAGIVLSRYSSDPAVQAALNQIGDVRKKIDEIMGK